MFVSGFQSRFKVLLLCSTYTAVMFRLCDFQIKRPEWGEAVCKAPGADTCLCGGSSLDAHWAFVDLMR